MSKRRAGSRQEVAAAAAGISVSSAHRIDAGRLQPKAAKPRTRRRPDPLAAVWEPLLLPLLERHPALTPTTLLEHLQEQKPDQDWTSVKRTLQRRVQQWKALHGPPPEVMFPLAYQPGEIGFCDFTKVKRVPITLRGEPFPHLLFHYRLAWSGWAYGQIVHGGESFVALSEGLQNGLAACGGVPKELRTDRLSAASRNRDGSYALDITPRYQALCAHYGFRARSVAPMAWGPGFPTAPGPGGSGPWPRWRRERPAAWRCGAGAAADGVVRGRAGGAVDRASAAGCGEHFVDPSGRRHHLSGSGPATCRHSAWRSPLLPPVQPKGGGGEGVD